MKNKLFEKDPMNAASAISHAHFLAFTPYVWEVSKLLKEKGALRFINEHKGVTIAEVAQQTKVPYYGMRVLLEAGLGIGLVYRKEGKYYITKAGYFFINDKSVEINYNYMRDVCFSGAKYLEDSIESGKPKGLKTLGEWETIYQGLSILPEPAKTSWFAFDHYYSDITFDEILPLVFKNNPKRILDIGGNTGKWSLRCLAYNQEVEMGIVDLQVQLDVARQNIQNHGVQNRVQYYCLDMLAASAKLPENYDVIWMSQFLDCFSDQQIISILSKCHRVADENTIVYINETFWDLQKYEASAFALQMTSLYFTTMANGNSQMYDSEVFFKLIDQAGFKIVEQHNMLGIGHTLLGLKKK